MILQAMQSARLLHASHSVGAFQISIARLATMVPAHLIHMPILSFSASTLLSNCSYAICLKG